MSTDSLLVKWRVGQGESGRKAAKSNVSRMVAGASSVEEFPNLPGVAVLRLQPARAAKDGRALDPAAAVTRLRQQIKQARATGLFAYVEPDYIVRTSAVPTDTAFTNGTLWGLRNTGQNGGVSGADIRAVQAWDVTTGSRDVVVAVIDTGIRYTHQDLAANMWKNPAEIPANGIDDDSNGYVDDVFGINAINNSGNPMDDNNHGTHCAGTIGAVANAGGPHVGVAWDVQLMALKFLSASGSGSTSDAIKCVDYAVAKRADIMSNSWGGGGFSQALFDSITAAERQGILFVAAAGNSSDNADVTPEYPASYRIANVISVAATDRRNALANFSNYGGSTVHLGAPGVEIYSCTAASDTAYDSFQGTSMACPHVAGVAALVKARYPSIGLSELKNRLVNTTTPVTALAGRTISGGLVNADNALRASPDGILEVSAASTSSPLPAGSQADFFVTVSDLQPVLNATVSARFGTNASVNMLDNGVAPDRAAGDGVYSGRLTVPTGVSTAQLNVDASAPGKQTRSASFDFAVAAPPINDFFAARIALASGTTRATGSNVLATQESGEPLNPAEAGSTTVWWSWTAPANATARIDTSGSDYDTTLAVYTGSSLGALALVASNDDDSGLTSAVTFSAVAGTTYLVQVSGYEGDTGSIVLRYPQPLAVRGEPVITEQPEGAHVEAGRPFSLRATAIDADSYQWYRNNTPVQGATSSTFSVAQANAAHEGVYRLVASNSAGSVGSVDARVIVSAAVRRPGNDALTARTLLPGASGRVDGSNRDASGEISEVDHAGVSQPLASVWYEWRAAADGVLTVGTLGSAFDTVLAVYSGATVPTLRLLAASDDEPGMGACSRVSLRVVAGGAYVIAVDGYGAAQGAVALDYTFVADSSAGSNDRFADAAVLATGLASGSNAKASRETGEPWHLAARETGGSSVWWKWTAPSDGMATVSTAGSDFDTILAVYDGSALATLRRLGSNDDDGDLSTSALQFSVLAGTTYYVAVDGYARAEGSIKLSLLLAPSAEQGALAQWASAHGLNPNTDGNFSADPDRDGHNNGAEFAFGSSPVLPSASLRQVQRSGNNFVISYLARQTGFVYHVERSTDLRNGFSRAMEVEIRNASSQVGVAEGFMRREFSVSVTGGAFYRVVATPQ